MRVKINQKYLQLVLNKTATFKNTNETGAIQLWFNEVFF